MTSIRRGTILSFNAAAWTAMVYLDGSDAEVQLAVGQWVQAQMMTTASEVGVLIFDDSNPDDGVVLGPYGALGLQDLNTTADPTFDALTLGSAGAAAGGQIMAKGSGAPGISSEIANADTNTFKVGLTLNHSTSGTAAASFGIDSRTQLQDDGGTMRPSSDDLTSWASAVSASRKARRTLYVYDATTSRECLRLETDGTQALISFLGAAAVARAAAYTQTYATTSRTHANPTASAPPAGGTGTAAGAYDTAAHRDALISSVTNLITDVANIKQVLNSLIDDLQALGLVN